MNFPWGKGKHIKSFPKGRDLKEGEELINEND